MVGRTFSKNWTVQATFSRDTRTASQWTRTLRRCCNGTASYYQQDGLGSITSLSSSAGALAQTYAYDNFGKVTASTGTLTNPFQYTGHEFDSESGLYFDRARYFDPSAGRFLSQDPIRFRGGLNFYAYVRNNPVVFKDVFGRVGHINADRIARAVLETLTRNNGGAPLLTLFEKWPAGQPAVWDVALTRPTAPGWPTLVVFQTRDSVRLRKKFARL
jgi:RHS repeat-associated protein